MRYGDFFNIAKYGNENWRGGYTQKEVACNAYNYLVEFEYSKAKSKVTHLISSLLELLDEDGYADSYNGKAYTAKIIRALKMVYAYFDGRTEEMEEALLEHCKGTEFFVENVIDKTQAQIFDYLSGIVRYEMESPLTQKKRNKKTKTTKVSAM